MKKESQPWIPFWVDRWLFGSTRIELAPDERSVWIDLLAIAAKHIGFIHANEQTPYSNQQLAGLLVIPEELLLRTLAKCMKYGKLETTTTNGYLVTNWNEYQLSERYKRLINQLNPDVLAGKTEVIAEKPAAIAEKADTIEDKIIEDNTTSSAKKTPTSEMFSLFCTLYQQNNNSKEYYVKKGMDGRCAKRMWAECKRREPNAPMVCYNRQITEVFSHFPTIQMFTAVEKYLFWNWDSQKPAEKPKIDKTRWNKENA